MAHHGGFAAYARVPADWVVPLPDAPELSQRRHHRAGRLAPRCCRCAGCVQHGTTPDDGPILVTGASGGVGSAAVALLANAGFEVVASSGKTAEHDYLKELGAARVVGRQFTEDDGRTLGPQLWGGVVDCVGGMALAEALRTVRYGGAVAASGLTGGNDLATTVYPFIVRGVALLGIDTVATPIEERRALWAEMADAFPLGALRGDGATRRSVSTGSPRRWTGCSTPPCAAAILVGPDQPAPTGQDVVGVDGRTLIVPLLHGAMAKREVRRGGRRSRHRDRGRLGGGAAGLGPDRHVGELVGELCARRRCDRHGRRAARRPAARWSTVSPFTIVTVSGAPLPE